MRRCIKELTVLNYRRWNYFFSCLISAIICICGTASIATNQKSKTESANTNSAQERTLTFPKGASIGRLSLIPHDYLYLGQEKLIGAASGTAKVRVPKDKLLALELSREAYVHPDRLELCSAVGLDVVNINFMAMEDSESTWCDAVLQHASHFKSLKCLLLNRSDVTDAGLSHLTGLRDLECISATMTGIKGDCFKTLAQYKNLQYLSLSDDPIKQENLKYLSNCPSLSYLDLHHTGVGELGIECLSKCANLSTLKLADNRKVDDACIKYLLNMKHASLISLDGTSVSFNGLKALKPLKLYLLAVSEGTCDRKDLPVLNSLAKYVKVVPRSHRVDKSTEQMWAPLHE